MENKVVVEQDNTVENQKEVYEEIEAEVIVFDEEDIIVASPNPEYSGDIG